MMDENLPPALRSRGNTPLHNQQPATPASPTPEQIREQAMREAQAKRPAAPTTSSAPAPQPASGLAYAIQGDDIQCVEITLQPQESVVGEGLNMMFYDQDIDMKVRMNSGEDAPAKGLLGKALDIGKAALTGEKIFMMTFTNTGKTPQKVGFAAPCPGKILAVDIRRYGGRILCRKGVFLCASKGVRVSSAIPKEISSGTFDSRVKMDKLEGAGMAFISAGGTVMERALKEGQVLHVATGALLAVQGSVNSKIITITNVGLTGQGYKLSELTGPGSVWLQSLPFEHLRDNIMEYTMEEVIKWEKKNNKK